MRVAIQGQLGSFHHLAALSYFGDNIELICCVSFAAVFDALAKRDADAALIAIENSIAGSVHAVYDLLLAHNFWVIGETYEHIHHCLIGLTGTRLADIKRVYSHPMALPQCADFLDKHLPGVDQVEFNDTAGSVSLIKKNNDRHAAALASALAAELNGMSVLHANVEDYPNNMTRFLAVGRRHATEANANKSSLVLETSHEPGALWQALGIFNETSLNLTKLESRPIPDQPWRYQFLVDVEGAGLKLHKAIKQLEQLDCSVRLLGEYVAAIKTTNG